MKKLNKLFENNRSWASKIYESEPDFFENLSGQQHPEYLWIGCSDSRVPANQIIGLRPGEIFVHRNVANLVVHTDLNCLSVIQYAVDVLKVKHIIVCGHYGCGGIEATLENKKLGLIDNWLRHIQDVLSKHQPAFSAIPRKKHWDTLCELNVIEQVVNVCLTTVIQDAWHRGQEISVHGWIYSLADGILKDLLMSISKHSEITHFYNQAITMRDV